MLLFLLHQDDVLCIKDEQEGQFQHIRKGRDSTDIDGDDNQAGLVRYCKQCGIK